MRVKRDISDKIQLNSHERERTGSIGFVETRPQIAQIEKLLLVAQCKAFRRLALLTLGGDSGSDSEEGRGG